MKSFLLNDNYITEPISLLLTRGRGNCEYLTTALDLIASVLENPAQSVHWLKFSHDRFSGHIPNSKIFPSLLDKHFDMKIEDFLCHDFLSKDFLAFEEECLHLCSQLDLDQVYRSRAQMLHLCEVIELLEE